ncbi:hypothetical protein FDV58_13580 [Bradyrhizobium elkanii]|uniref:DUF1508 domain-containing protein n=1 Tax=Bradyrhizobium elkanii TaxID=29448 RepID=A0A4U6S2B7_BRAEL|nr:hypothetical protein [Bradyrhizobium sp. BR2003]TKV81161.1 hypothetical protein FDV58_13580 [Bradyrhizobium elkanii]
MSVGSYKGIEYSIIQSIYPRGWRWTIQTSTKSGQSDTAPTQHEAKVAVFRAIDQVAASLYYQDLDLRHYFVARV